MNKYIQKLRERPENERKQIALMSTIVLSGLIFIFWITILPSAVADQTNQINAKDVLTPISAIKESAKDTYDQIKTNTQTIVNDSTVDLENSNDTETGLILSSDDPNIENTALVNENSDVNYDNIIN